MTQPDWITRTEIDGIVIMTCRCGNAVRINRYLTACTQSEHAERDFIRAHRHCREKRRAT